MGFKVSAAGCPAVSASTIVIFLIELKVLISQRVVRGATVMEVAGDSLKRVRVILTSIILSILTAICVPSYSEAVGRAWTNNLSESSDPHALKVLIVGNSKFYWHDMPKMLVYLLRSGNPNLALKLTEVQGDAFTLEEHWADGTARRMIRERGPWDYVVLLERTGRAESPEETQFFEQALTEFAREVEAAKARLVLTESYNDDEDRAEDHLTHTTIASAASRHKAYVMPVGSAWASVRAHHPHINLYDEDNHHPGLKGTYLMACVFYSFFTGHSAENLPISLNYDDARAHTRYVLTDALEGRALQSTAWSIVAPMFAGKK
jgi:hypothetical protein